ncbi:PadR family transcriptional regulator [Candidatus Nanohalobium constans]|uniref:PadR family transcriptional regulator n=1 Tax=Candidatus Nanohalobium constans TaxID=2565781 RepID=A0A5Q0UGZ6_9ARCH|nr:PadR family transcriptional regulator [Candidatus Nanohalobium constans]QGA80898.1 PadR family transcriptional regulator [Candidatus Nanohalobium constans]
MSEPNLNHTYRVYTLLLLKMGSRHGYEIIDRIGEVTGKDPSTSHIYPFLSELEENDYVVSENGSRGKKIYSLTEEGKDFVGDQLDSFGEMLHAAIRDEIDECSHCSCKIYDNGYEDDGDVFCCRHCAGASG